MHLVAENAFVSGLDEHIVQWQPLNRALGQTFGDDRDLRSVQKNVAAVEIAKDWSAHVHRVQGASIFVLVEHAEDNPCIFEVSHNHINRGHILYYIASSARSPEI